MTPPRTRKKSQADPLVGFVSTKHPRGRRIYKPELTDDQRDAIAFALGRSDAPLRVIYGNRYDAEILIPLIEQLDPEHPAAVIPVLRGVSDT